jgi:hypothetical protein
MALLGCTNTSELSGVVGRTAQPWATSGDLRKQTRFASAAREDHSQAPQSRPWEGGGARRAEQEDQVRTRRDHFPSVSMAKPEHLHFDIPLFGVGFTTCNPVGYDCFMVTQHRWHDLVSAGLVNPVHSVDCATHRQAMGKFGRVD